MWLMPTNTDPFIPTAAGGGGGGYRLPLPAGAAARASALPLPPPMLPGNLESASERCFIGQELRKSVRGSSWQAGRLHGGGGAHGRAGKLHGASTRD